jgi:hypothetical protein
LLTVYLSLQVRLPRRLHCSTPYLYLSSHPNTHIDADEFSHLNSNSHTNPYADANTDPNQNTYTSNANQEKKRE